MNWSTFAGAVKRYDFSVFGITGLIFCAGVLNLYSATHASEHMASLYKSQIMWFALSLVAGMGLSLTHPKNFFQYAWVLYVVSILFLVFVLLFGQKVMGAQRWIVFGSMRMQPSEIAKVALVLVLSRWFSKQEPNENLDLKGFALPCIITSIPVVLIAMEAGFGNEHNFMSRFFWRSLFTKSSSGRPSEP